VRIAKPRRRRTSTAAWRPSEDTVTQRVGEGIVLVHLPTDRIYSLNPTATRLWELLAARKSL